MTDNTQLAAELAAEVEDFERPNLTEMHRSELEAEVVHQAKLIERFRQSICNIVRAIEDEGDRVYLGSSNDADELRELDEKLTDCGNELFMPWAHGDDLYADLRDLRTEVGKLTGQLRTAETALAALTKPAVPDVREAIVSGLEVFCRNEPDFDMSYGMRQVAADHILARPQLFAALTQSPSCCEAGREAAKALGKSHSYTGATSPIQVTLGFHSLADRDAFIEAHIAAIRERAIRGDDQ